MSSDDNDNARPRSAEKGIEIITHLAHYGGWPIAVGAFRVLEEVAVELREEHEEEVESR